MAFSLFWDGFGGLGVGHAELRSSSPLRLIGTSEGYLRGPLGASRQEASKSMALRQKVQPCVKKYGARIFYSAIAPFNGTKRFEFLL